MKKVVSNLLIFATLILGCKFTYAGTTPIVRTSPSLNRLNNDDIQKVFSELAKDPEFSAALKEAFLELSKDKKFTDQVIKNYENAHKDPIWLRLLKLPFKTVWYLIKTTFNYVVGKNVAKFLAWTIPIALIAIDGYFGFNGTSILANGAVKVITWIFA